MGDKMKITGLNIDCLENVFEYLGFDDLLNVASSNKRLNKAANFVFIRKPWHKVVWLIDFCLSRERSFGFYGNSIEIKDLRTSLLFLRCFGHLVSEVNVLLPQSFENTQHAINYISEYCSENLIRIAIGTYSLKEFEQLKKPFSKVEEIKLFNSYVADKDFLNRVFPKLRKLEVDLYKNSILGDNEKSFFVVNANHFPNLEQLSISDHGDSSSALCGETIAPILRLNPQLSNLKIWSCQPLFDSIDFQDAMKTLQNLKTLSLSEKMVNTSSSDSVICLNSVQTFYLHYRNSTKIPFLFDQICTLSVNAFVQLDDEFFNFIDKHPAIQDFNIGSSSGVLDHMVLSKIAKSLPLLVSINLWFKISADEAIDFMNKFKNLNGFSFQMSDTNVYVEFQERLSNEWECSVFGVKIEVKRVGSKAKKHKAQ